MGLEKFQPFAGKQSVVQGQGHVGMAVGGLPWDSRMVHRASCLKVLS